MIDICKDKLWTYSLRNNVIMYENSRDSDMERLFLDSDMEQIFTPNF